jgi:hypothetical protein
MVKANTAPPPGAHFFFRPFHYFLAVLEVVKFMSVTLRNCRPFALSLFSVYADGVIPRAQYSPDNKYCFLCNLFQMECENYSRFIKTLSFRNYFVSVFTSKRANYRKLFSLVRSKNFCQTTDRVPQKGCKA